MPQTDAGANAKKAVPKKSRAKTSAQTSLKTTSLKTAAAKASGASKTAKDEKPALTQKKRPARKTTRRPARPKISKDVIAEIFARFERQDPSPKGELEHHNAFTLLVAVVLSAQATDAGVNKATRDLFKVADTPEKMVALGEDAIRDYVKTIGLFRNKAKNVFKLSQDLIDKHNSEVPANRDTLETLPGVGRKTANVVMNVWFKQPAMAVDTHVFRICNRLGLAPGKTPLEVEEILLKVVPAEYGVPAHHWLILHGRYTCTARKPACPGCLLHDLCIFKSKTPGPG